MFKFVQPWYLLGLAGLTVPVLIHLIRRMRADAVIFPSLRFISQSPVPRQGRKRIHDWLLLLLRCLIFVCLILILAQPQWDPTAGRMNAQPGKGPTVLLIDQSASMQGWGAQDDARRAALNLLAQSEGDKFGLILFANDIIASVPPTDDLERIASLIRETSPTYRHGDPMPAIEEAIRLLSVSTFPGTLIVISDFQRSDWGMVNWPAISPNHAVRFIRAGENRDSNLAIHSAQVFPVEENKKRIIAEVANYSESMAERRIMLQLDGKKYGKDIQVPPLQNLRVIFEVVSPDKPQAILRLDDDNFALDNIFYLWAGPLPAIQVVLYTPSGGGENEEAFFLSKALSVHTGFTGMHFEALQIDLFFLDHMTLDQADAVFLPAETASAEDIDWDILRGFVEKGGVLMLSLNQEALRVLHRLQKAGLWNGEYQGIEGRGASHEERYSVGWINPQSNLAHIFRAEAARDLMLVDIYQYVKIGPDHTGTPLLKDTQDKPLLIEHSLGKGRLFIATFPWRTSWTDLPIHNCYVPLTHEIMKLSDTGNHRMVRLECGERLPSHLKPEKPLDTGMPGIHLIESIPVEINVPPSESGPETVSTSELEKVLAKAQRSFSGQAQAQRVAIGSGRSVVSLWPWLAAACIPFFVVENLLTFDWRKNRKKTNG